MVSAFDLNGQLITSLRDPDARLNQVTSVNECDGKLILGSLVSSGIGVLELDDSERHARLYCERLHRRFVWGQFSGRRTSRVRHE